MEWTLKRILTRMIVLAFIGTMIFYAYYQSRDMLRGPTIALETPTEGMIATSSLIHVRGVAKEAKELTLNGRDIFVDLKGAFDERLLLQDGYNIIELTAKDSGGKEIRTTVALFFIAPEDGTASTTITSSNEASE